ncbi:MAG: hypothetical protein FJW40_11195 [Acidobacteria bacterium]|nr:hypothetical protein [Acidobacteriota bacterium]
MAHRLTLFLASTFAAWGQTAADRAIVYLNAEVPRWNRENGCYSCHNNGDAARALFATGHADPGTLRWLASSGLWDTNRGNAAVSDKRLARLSFSVALAAALEHRLIQNPAPLLEAARLLVKDQDKDGSWTLDPGDEAGSPVTYGAPLATHLARRVLAQAGAGFAEPARRAEAWLAALKPRTNLDHAVRVLEGGPAETLTARQNSDGGWGAFPGSPSEVFDTAVVLIALRNKAKAPEERGRRWLEQSQLPSGGWPGTTRPAGGASYAQHVSTTGWALLALVETRK